jgi:tetratricopeptide (TPR) repeat protein
MIRYIFSNFFLYCTALLLVLSPLSADAQKGILSILEDPLKAGDDAYLTGDYALALKNYQEVSRKDNGPKNIDLRLARSYFLTHSYKKACDAYTKFLKGGNNLAPIDQYYYAETLTSVGDYELAKQIYTSYYEKNPNKTIVAAKIWRINNIRYLYEDSLKNAVHFAEINTTYNEFQMLSYGKGVLLTSNRPTVNLIKKLDKNRGVPFNHLFYSDVQNDPFSIGAYFYKSLTEIGTGLPNKFHIGPVSIYNSGKKMAYVANSSKPDDTGYYPLKLYFAVLKKDKWEKAGSFPMKERNTSISEVTIAEAGDVLYFSAVMEGGYGGADIYRSECKEGKWSVPENLGATVNTDQEEVFPFLHSGGILYFSSNGHPGLGGLDIFKVKIQNNEYYEIENLGYPLNSGFDDFAFSVDSLRRQGFLTSNRAKGGLDNDIYEIDMNLQAYPLEVNGTVKFIEHNWMDSTELELLPDVTLKLIDIATAKVVATSKSNSIGEFAFIVPYYSQYKIQIQGQDLDGIVSFEVPKYAKENQNYEIVVVNDDFKVTARE